MTGFADKNVIAELTAKMLIEVEAVRFMTDKPFIFTSGWASPGLYRLPAADLVSAGAAHAD